MSKFGKKSIYFPQLLKIELQIYQNGHLLWISGPNATIFRFFQKSVKDFPSATQRSWDIADPNPDDQDLSNSKAMTMESSPSSPQVTSQTDFVLKESQMMIQNSRLNYAQDFYQLLKTRPLQKKNQSIGLLQGQLQKTILSTSTGYKKSLTLRGVGYKFQKKNRILTLQIGYSHQINILIPSDIQMKFNRKFTGIRFQNSNDAFLHGLLSSLKHTKKPDVYKGKGIRYKKETVIRKEGKKKKTF